MKNSPSEQLFTLRFFGGGGGDFYKTTPSLIITSPLQSLEIFRGGAPVYQSSNPKILKRGSSPGEQAYPPPLPPQKPTPCCAFYPEKSPHFWYGYRKRRIVKGELSGGGGSWKYFGIGPFTPRKTEVDGQSTNHLRNY